MWYGGGNRTTKIFLPLNQTLTKYYLKLSYFYLDNPNILSIFALSNRTNDNQTIEVEDDARYI